MVLALRAVATREDLGTDTDNLAGGELLDLGADLRYLADDLVSVRTAGNSRDQQAVSMTLGGVGCGWSNSPSNAGENGSSPATSDGVDVRPANTTVAVWKEAEGTRSDRARIGDRQRQEGSVSHTHVMAMSTSWSSCFLRS